MMDIGPLLEMEIEYTSTRCSTGTKGMVMGGVSTKAALWLLVVRDDDSTLHLINCDTNSIKVCGRRNSGNRYGNL